MNTPFSLIKGLHPGIFLSRELKNRNLKKGKFAIAVNEYPQTLGDITNGKRSMNLSLALRIEAALNLDEGYLMMLQLYYDIQQEKQKQNQEKPDLTKLRRILFWDTSMDKIDWQKNKRAVIKRIFERGNSIEKDEITHFYGQQTINSILSKHA